MPERTWHDLSIWPGDIMLTRGSTRVNRLIRRFSDHAGEVVEADHTGLFTRVSSPGDSALVLEATNSTVQRRPLRDSSTLILRPINLDNRQRVAIAKKGEEYEGRRYGYVKIALHIADYMIGGRYFFRRLAFLDRYPICSWHVAHAYASMGLDFGVKPGEAQPHDIHRFAVAAGSPYRTIGVWGEWDRIPPAWSQLEWDRVAA